MSVQTSKQSAQTRGLGNKRVARIPVSIPFIRFLKQQSISLIISLSFLMLFIVIIPLYYLEPEINSFIEAFWSGLLSLLFFGRSNFEPSTMAGNIILVLLSIMGVVLYGLVISTIFDVIFQSKYTQALLQRWKKHSKK
ncbi:hypothetical protein ACE1TI_20930 [Alteribacillus sp. JSM 102045]|uniref:hypothetical protein n=1 Tax=Alteribacillus sp. JSM 102045 TaxID=1562101 RepID=UPI0035BFEDB2